MTGSARRRVRGGPHHAGLLVARILAVLALASGVSSLASGVDALELSALDGANGFVLRGPDGEQVGMSVDGAGDVDADGFPDIVVGALRAAPNGENSGAAYVVFGRPWLGASGSIDLGALDGSNGFAMNGAAPGDWTGLTVCGAGDLNDDGIDDLAVGALYADVDGLEDAGVTYVVFGGPGIGGATPLALSTLDGTNGFVVRGGARDDRTGLHVAPAGDVNADGVDDLLISGYRVDQNGFEAGAAYVVFGGSGVGASGVVELSSLDGSNGFAAYGIAAEDFAGNSVGAAGDVNADGADDIIIGALGVDQPSFSSGAAYVVFGGSGVGTGGAIELSSLDGTNGFVARGAAVENAAGRAVSGVGDVNADGYDDVFIGAIGADETALDSGAAYVVFGRPGVGATGVIELSALDGAAGFAMGGVAEEEQLGRWLGAAGDVNRDGVADFVVGGWYAAPGDRFKAGAAYVVHGASGIGDGGTFSLSSLNGSNGYVAHGVAEQNLAGRAVAAAGDVNGDGADDVLIGAPGAGDAYVVFGDPGGPAMSVRGMRVGVGLCLNRTTGAQQVVPGGASDAVDCPAMNVPVTSGQQVQLVTQGRVDGSGTLGGGVFGLEPNTATAICRNARTGQGVQFAIGLATGFDCEAFGLVVAGGDPVAVVVIGAVR